MSQGSFRHVPVTEDGSIKGVVSLGDLKGMELEEYRWQYVGPARAPERVFRQVGQIIEGHKPVMAPEDEMVQRACRVMRRRRSGSILIVDSQKRLSGIFTGRDAVRALARREDPATTRVADAMTTNPVTITPESSAIDALRIMDDGGFRHLPVVALGKILGVVSRSDFTAVEIDRLDEEEHLKEVIW
jgi:CBS domain-containing protein